MDPRYEEAVRSARAGDPRAFRTVAEHLGPELVRFLTYFLHGDVHAANDVAQDTLIRAWGQLDTIQDARHLRRWCYRVARCKAVSWLRRRVPPGRHMESIDFVRDDGGGAPELPGPPTPPPRECDDLVSALRRAITRLPMNYAGPVHLHYVQGCSTRETADLLGLKRTTVKMRLYRARAFLRREIHRDQQKRGRPLEPVRRPHP